MAIRNIVTKGDAILTKKCRPVTEVNEKIITLLDDMLETMEKAEGVGIAAPQVGMLKRLCICRPDEETYFELINPEILETKGSQGAYEGCLSVPGLIGYVERPEYVKVKTMTRDGDEVTLELEGFAATVACHEMDHLDGVLYVDKAKDIHNPEVADEKITETTKEDDEE